jgi:hypothetical protein
MLNQPVRQVSIEIFHKVLVRKDELTCGEGEKHVKGNSSETFSTSLISGIRKDKFALERPLIISFGVSVFGSRIVGGSVEDRNADIIFLAILSQMHCFSSAIWKS